MLLIPHPEEGRRPVSKGEARVAAQAPSLTQALKVREARVRNHERACGAKDNMHMFLRPRPR
jgi:hypothetical protein